MVLESTVGIAKVGTKSLRATVPEGIVSYLEIEAGDKLEWKMDLYKGKRMAVVTKSEIKRRDVSQYVRPEEVSRSG